MATKEESSVEQEHMLELLNNVNAGLDKLNNDNIPKISEKIFAGVFVPVFAGEASLYGATIETWIKFAGSPYNEVRVVNGVGNVLFTVPPLYERGNVNVEADKRVSVSHIVTSAQQFAKIHPNQGKAYLANELGKKALLLKVPANIVKNLEFWNMVFKRYNRPEIIPTKLIKESADTFVTNPDDFEDL